MGSTAKGQPGGLATLDGDGVLEQAQLPSIPALSLDGSTVTETEVVEIHRPEIEGDPSEAEDMWRWLYMGVRGFYINEFGCGRARDPEGDQISFRAMAHALAGPNQTIFQVALSDLTEKFGVDVSGDARLARDLLVGRDIKANGLSLLPGSLVTFTLPTGVQGADVAKPINDGNVGNTGAPPALGAVLSAALRRVWLQGAIFNNSGGNLTAQTTLATLPVGVRPGAWEQFPARTSTNLAARVTVKPNGVIVMDQALADQAFVSIGGFNFAPA